jgi:hypothetical protein
MQLFCRVKPFPVPLISSRVLPSSSSGQASLEKRAMSNNAYNNGYKTGLNGGKVNTNGMPSQQRESTDAGVNAGNAARGNK